jgi:hypothetical protein
VQRNLTPARPTGFADQFRAVVAKGLGGGLVDDAKDLVQIIGFDAAL